MKARRWATVLFVSGSIAIVAGILDPMEGSVVIAAGAAVALAGIFLGRRPRREAIYWLWTFLLIAAGVGAMFAWSSVGGFGGRTGRSMWWALTILPYPVGWVMAVRAIVHSIINHWKAGHATA